MNRRLAFTLTLFFVAVAGLFAIRVYGPTLFSEAFNQNLAILGFAFLILIPIFASWGDLKNTFFGTTQSDAPKPIDEQGEKLSRKLLINHVRTLWITGVLQNSLHNSPLIGLKVKPESDRTIRPWAFKWLSENKELISLEEDRRVDDIFQTDANEALLILGEPGSGKTITLLDLTTTLLNRAENDPEQKTRIPVVFNLSSWAAKSPPLKEWLIDELNKSYSVSPNLSADWLNNNSLILMLDGLDEVQRSKQQACVKAINDYRTQHGQTGMVVCSRVEEYEALETKLDLKGSLLIQPLSLEQAETYLENFGQPLRDLLREDEQLQEWSEKPLILNIVATAYGGLTAEELTQRHTGSLTTLYESYVHRVLHEHRPDQPDQFKPEETIHHLTWLAARLKEKDQTIYLIENMQPDWLNSQTQNQQQRPFWTGPLKWILGKREIEVNDRSFSWEAARDHLTKEWRKLLFIVLFIGLFVGLFSGLIAALESELADGLFAALIFGALSLGLTDGLIFGLATGPLAGLILGLSLGLKGGFANGTVNKHISPNQGTRNNLKVGLISGLAPGLFFGLFAVLFFERVYGLGAALFAKPTSGLFIGLVFGLFFGLFSGLVFGLWAFCRHFILRTLLSRSGYLPLGFNNLIPFLNEAKSKLLLQQVGGGYIFIHRTLLEYFASLEDQS